MNNRQSIPKETQTMVLTKSKRRCALCYGLNNDTNEKTGQIAHLDKNRNNNNFNNLVWLCFDHHDKYVSAKLARVERGADYSSNKLAS